MSRFDFFDVLRNEQVRQAIKDRSGLNTLPQLYVAGELIGGVDATAAALAEGALLERIPAECMDESVGVQLQVLLYVNQGTPILFTNSTADESTARQQAAAAKILSSIGVVHDVVDLGTIANGADVEEALFQKAELRQLPQLWIDQEVMAGFPSIDCGVAGDEDPEEYSWLLEAVDPKYIQSGKA